MITERADSTQTGSVDLFRKRLHMSGGVIIPDKETARKLNELARHQQIVRLLADIRADMMICELEGWDRMEYINQLKELLDSIGE